MQNPFLTGAIVYPALELLARGRTHYSMAIAGGASFMLIRRVQRLRLPLWKRALLCGAGITAIEYACGCIWNRRHQVWDYRNMPLHVRGQVCLPFTLLWCALSGGVMTAMEYCGNACRRDVSR